MKKEKKLVSVWVVEVGLEAKIVVKKGKRVKAGEVLALREKNKVEKIFFPNWLKRASGAWEKGRKKLAGDKLSLGEILFESRKFTRKLQWHSPLAGEIIRIDKDKGFLEILVGKEKEELAAPLSGTITKASGGEIAISFPAQEFKGQGLGSGVGWGKLTYLPVVSLPDLNIKHQGQVLLVEEISSSLVEKGAALGVSAFIAFSKELDLEDSSLPVLTLEVKSGKKSSNLKIELLAGQFCFVDPAHNQVLVCLQKNEKKANN
ncbi:MAG: hypothetical protein ABIB61_01475 [Candidatus Shapirobacteria bacterium]